MFHTPDVGSVMTTPLLHVTLCRCCRMNGLVNRLACWRHVTGEISFGPNNPNFSHAAQRTSGGLVTSFFFSFFFFVSRKSFSCPPSENQRHSSAAAKVTNLLVWVQEIRFGKTKRSCQPGVVRPAAPASDCLRSGRLVAPPPCSYTVRAHSSN